MEIIAFALGHPVPAQRNLGRRASCTAPGGSRPRKRAAARRVVPASGDGGSGLWSGSGASGGRRYGSSGGGGDGGGAGGRGGAGGEDGGEARRAQDAAVAGAALELGQVKAVLTKYGQTLQSLSADVRFSVTNGECTAAVLERVLQAEALPFGLGALAQRIAPFRNRLVGSPAFLMTMGVELAIGFSTKTVAEVRTRKERFWKEFDFYLSDIALEIIGDFVLVWLLSPSASFGPATKASFLSRLPSHVFQKGASFSLPQRMACLLNKGAQFALTGFTASMIGHSITKALVARRPLKEGETRAELAPVLQNSLEWGKFMGVSSNVRYMAVNGIEERMLSKLYSVNVAAATVATAVLRFGNCYFGGVHWLKWAREAHLQ
ncbi:Protein RETICULATA-RELATED 1, chloroplastic [Porphyridium purpureum]|uniref:Protein RETICULATA-RELATED 1, chloroplastic n=1 Tax=Porphyridium purpureum TaxID=35688 RepID=A0A5J4YKA3_PORPP|nr:Protein RETICULATA-RELATED 1, chloroplastic [Porphyridium purpureum]|eukprot:POR2333..scf291_13